MIIIIIDIDMIIQIIVALLAGSRREG